MTAKLRLTTDELNEFLSEAGGLIFYLYEEGEVRMWRAPRTARGLMTMVCHLTEELPSRLGSDRTMRIIAELLVHPL